VVKEALLLMILRMLGLQAHSPADIQRLNGSRPYVQNLVTRAHAASIEISAAVREDHARRLAGWKRGTKRPVAFQADLLAAVLMKESTFREGIIGKAGEVGMAQIKPDGRGAKACSDLDLHRPHQNLLCSIRLLRFGIERCGDIESGLAYYNGTPTCEPTGYSQRVLDILNNAKPKVVAER
jgi:hypothetical protein